MLAFFEEARLIDDQYGLRSTEILDHIGAQIVAQGIGIPYRSSQQMLDPIVSGTILAGGSGEDDIR